MQGVMFSVRPEYCKRIAAGEKGIEVRKRAPKLPTPYKGYLYCTLQKRREDAFNLPISREEMLRDIPINGMKCMSKYANGKVWAEFICDADIPLMFACSDPAALTTHFEVPGTCLSDVEIMDYLGNGVEGHSLHISELKIYDRPRDISDFKKADACQYLTKDGCKYPYHCFRAGQLKRCGDYLERPPQSWCYVEEIP